MIVDKKEFNGILKLLLVTIFWGIGFPAMKIITESFTTFYQVGIRFFIAAVVLAIIFHSRLKLMNKQTLKSGFILSVFLFSTYVFATKGVEYTSASRASFFCCLAVIIVPLILSFVLKNKLGKRTIISICICAVGLITISYTTDMGLFFNLGDALCLLCSCCSAIHIVITGRIVKESDPALITWIQMLFISCFAFVAAIFVEPIPSDIHINSVYALVFIGIFGTGVSFYLQTSCQQYISPTKVGIIFSLEPVNGVIASFLILGDQIGVQTLLGGALIFFSLIFAETQSQEAEEEQAMEEVVK